MDVNAVSGWGIPHKTHDYGSVKGLIQVLAQNCAEWRHSITRTVQPMPAWINHAFKNDDDNTQ